MQILIAAAAVLGCVVGSFLNVVIHRLPRGESIVRPRSRCPGCGASIAAFDNVPILSWLWLRGRCRRCRAPISWRYPAVEALTGALFAAIAWRHGLAPDTLLWMAFAAALVAAAAIDFDHRIIPDEISLGGLAVGLLAVPALAVLDGARVWPAVAHSAGGALVGGGLVWATGFAHARLSAALGRRFDHWPGEAEAYPRPSSLDYWMWFPGIGFGDVKLLAMVGAFLGPFGVAQTIVAASLAGLVLGVGYGLATRRWSAPFGFGPAIAAGALLVLLAPADLVALP
jgi:leader peptidase (prepilin peptidase)/N-methyltransferase